MKTSIIYGGPLPETSKEFQDNKDKMRYTHCCSCERFFTNVNVHSEGGWRETQISGLCETCFDKLFKDERA